VAYLDSLLARDEHVILQSRRHPLFMVLNAGPYVVGAFAVWAVALLAIIFVPDVGGVNVGLIFGLILLAVSLVPLMTGLFRFLHWRKEQYIVTNYRIVQIEGLVNRRVFDSALEKVNDVVLTQPLFGRIFNYGSINIVTGSEAAINDIAGVARPYEFKRALLEAKMAFGSREYGETARRSEVADRLPAEERYEAHTERLPNAGAASDPSRAVIALTELRNAGVITDAEYSEKLKRLTGAE
jgi:uncharacterized membrane protein YdbT with pleckstrin-like domain